MPDVDMSHAARREFLSLPPEVADAFKELADLLQKNPHRLPPWCEVKSIGRVGGKKVFRARVADYRATYVFDRQLIRFTRFRLRKSIGYTALPKS